jgi:hypothetical protein
MADGREIVPTKAPAFLERRGHLTLPSALSPTHVPTVYSEFINLPPGCHDIQFYFVSIVTSVVTSDGFRRDSRSERFARKVQQAIAFAHRAHVTSSNLLKNPLATEGA